MQRIVIELYSKGTGTVNEYEVYVDEQGYIFRLF